MTGTDDPNPSPHRDIATRLLDGRTSAGGPAVSPDGRYIAFVVATIELAKNATTSRIWLAGPDGPPAPVTNGPHDGGPVWSPDGRWLAFGSRRGEKETESTLHILPVGVPGEVRTVATMPDGLGDLAWSPDGRWLAYTSRTRDPRYEAKDERWQPPRRIEQFFARLDNEGWVFDRPKHVYVVAADGTAPPRNLTPGPYQHTGISWLADSSAIVTGSPGHEGWDRDLCEDLYVVPLDGSKRALTKQTGVYALPSVSPDGSTVAFLGFDDSLTFPQNARVGVIPIAGGQHRWISTDLDRGFQPTAGVRQPVWLDDETVIATAEDRGDTHLFRLRADGSEPPVALTSGRLAVAGYHAAGGRIAMAQATVERPAEIVTLDGPVTAVTTSFRDWEKFTVPTTDGTAEIDAWIMRPDGFEARRRYPVLLNVHGGPFTQYGETFFDEAQMQAAAGFVVLMSNPRGGSGRETSWGQAIMGPAHPTVPGPGWGSVDVDDVIAVLDGALARYRFCDPDRVGMLGGSYGGYMATQLAGRFSDRFRGICSERAVNNLVSEEWSSDIATAFRAEHGVNHLEDPELYAAMSPIRYVADIDVPMLLLHSENDFRCPISQAEELFVALRLLGKDVTFYRFPGEGHELSRSGSPVHRRMRAEIILDWFTEHLAPRRRRVSRPR
ncbi:MAG TPA: S9 family peptidase [Ilumatobacteraceae bacterium]|nr:S9 family peptidase [Ilumatobacteraceae bacterium]